MDYMLENYEWDNTWIEKTEQITEKRVLYIGDSISCGTRTQANIIADGEILFDGFGTSKSLDNPYYVESLLSFTKQGPDRKVIIFNNGLHGWHIPEDRYEELYVNFVNELVVNFPDTVFVLVLTTFVTNEKFHNDRVIERNEIAMKIAKRFNLPIIDLYTVSEENKEFISDDGVHFLEKGYQILANEVLSVVKEYL